MSKNKKREPQNNLKELLEIKNSTDTTADLFFYGDIVADEWYAWENTDQYPMAVKDFLANEEGKDLNIYINSGGGSVFAGMAIYNMLKRHKGKKIVHIDGLCGSIATVIALAGDEIHIPNNAFFMIHKPWTSLWGGFNSIELEKMAQDLTRIEEGILNVYEANIQEGVSMDTIKDLVNAETWLTGEEASKYFRVQSTTPLEVVACVSDTFKSCSKVPKDIVQAMQDNKTKEKDLVNSKLKLIQLQNKKI